jgi:preprotein translocase SecE subunit
MVVLFKLGENMAEKSDKPAKKRQLKKVETVRERVERAGNDRPQKRSVSSIVGTTGKPFKVVGKGIAKLLRPFAFVMRPFKTRPVRFIGRMLAIILLLRFFRDAWKEVRQVEWPDMRTTFRLAIAVFVFSILFGILIAITDFGLDKVFRKVFID